MALNELALLLKEGSDVIQKQQQLIEQLTSQRDRAIALAEEFKRLAQECQERRAA